MRYSAIIFFGLVMACGHGRNNKEVGTLSTFGLFKFYQNDTTKTRLAEVVRTDSIYVDSTGYKVIKSFDKLDTLVQELKYHLFQNDTRRAYLTRNLYDKDGHVVIYELFNMEGRRLEGIKYSYRDNGLMIRKEEMNSGNN